jgi:hypothetical protein
MRIAPLLLVVITAGALRAQSVGFAIEAAPIYIGGMSNGALQGLSGPGYDAGVRLRFSQFSLGAAAYGATLGNGTLSNVRINGFLAEPRYDFAAMTSDFHPFVAVQLGTSDQFYPGSSFYAGTSNYANGAKASGTVLGGGGGLSIRIARTLNVDASVLWEHFSFGAGDLYDVSTTGSSLVFRAGVAWWLR